MAETVEAAEEAVVHTAKVAEAEKAGAVAMEAAVAA